ncbi:MAG TPA: FAD-binding protein [Xanthobacteraceae bacterium]
MDDGFKARDANDVEAAVQWALGNQKSLEIVGRGTKRTIGRPAQVDATLDLAGLAGVTLYEPEELVLSARAGTSLAEIEALVEAAGQQLAFEPMDFGPLLGGATRQATIGGALAANLSGPRRIKAGAARDHFLGCAAVSGRGEIFKSGGRVVKNVTGYDLCKLLAGSWGTLAAMTDVTIKTLPAPETEANVMVLGLDIASATHAMAAAMGSSCDVSGAAHLESDIAVRASDDLAVGRSVTALRVEGVAPSVVHRQAALMEILAPFGMLGTLNESQSRALWRAIRDVVPFAAQGPAGDRIVWRLSVAPSMGATAARLIAQTADAEFLFDWAGGLVWAALAPSDDGGAAAVRAATASCGGHATLIRAPAALRASVAAFEPQPDGLAALSKRVKEGFDPRGVLGPGRMWAGV